MVHVPAFTLNLHTHKHAHILHTHTHSIFKNKRRNVDQAAGPHSPVSHPPPDLNFHLLNFRWIDWTVTCVTSVLTSVALSSHPSALNIRCSLSFCAPCLVLHFLSAASLPVCCSTSCLLLHSITVGCSLFPGCMLHDCAPGLYKSCSFPPSLSLVKRVLFCSI